MAGKTVQISTALLYDLFAYFLRGNTDEFTETAIIDALNSKLDAIIKHELYTAYKTADTPENREKARQAYLNEVGIKASHRWPGEYRDSQPTG